MQVVERHRIDRHDSRWAAIDTAALASKNLYNAALYLTRQAYMHQEGTHGSRVPRARQPPAAHSGVPSPACQGGPVGP